MSNSQALCGPCRHHLRPLLQAAALQLRRDRVLPAPAVPSDYQRQERVRGAGGVHLGSVRRIRQCRIAGGVPLVDLGVRERSMANTITDLLAVPDLPARPCSESTIRGLSDVSEDIQ